MTELLILGKAAETATSWSGAEAFCICITIAFIIKVVGEIIE